MFFIARCLFWLSLVFLNLPGERAGVDAGAFLAAAHAGAEGAIAGKGTMLAAQMAGGSADWCKTHGDLCADAVLAAMGAKTSGRPSGRGVDTLTPADRAPRWQGARG